MPPQVKAIERVTGNPGSFCSFCSDNISGQEIDLFVMEDARGDFRVPICLKCSDLYLKKYGRKRTS